MLNTPNCILEESTLLARMQSRVQYDSATGIFSRVKSGLRGGRTGCQPGHLSAKGYQIIRLFGKAYKAHRLAWFFVHGRWPAGQIDHLNGLRTDNRIANLRDVPQSTNMQNQRRAMKTNQSGFLGVTTVAKTGKFISQIKEGDQSTYLGTFLVPEEAHAAYLAAKRLKHAGCTI